MYALIKALEFFLAPGDMLVVLLAIGVGLQWTRWRSVGLIISTISTALLVILLLFPIGFWLLKPLEDKYPRPTLPKHIDGVLVLGGVFNPGVYLSRGAPDESDVEGRLVAAAELMRRYPDARLIFSGGSGDPGIAPEADAARLALDELGLDQRRVSYENRSRTTWENLLYSQKLAKPNEVWVLTTSASQMPRAMVVAKMLGWKLIPWPSDYKTPTDLYSAGIGPNADLALNLATVNMALHEWIGILAYRVSGRPGQR
jgi:uncharacterized SAM-binding protein YcdF (DUF218 family)